MSFKRVQLGNWQADEELDLVCSVAVLQYWYDRLRYIHSYDVNTVEMVRLEQIISNFRVKLERIKKRGLPTYE